MPDAVPRVIRLSWQEWLATRVAKKTALEAKGTFRSVGTDNRQTRSPFRIDAHSRTSKCIY